MTLQEDFGLQVLKSTLTDKKQCHFGLECELEAVRNPKPHGIFVCKEDGSLRNRGYEFISSPENKQVSVKGFEELHKWITFYDKEDPFSSRTSTHVHMNCMALTAEEARNLVLLYALFEEFFFTMVKPERRNNIHCVALTDTHLPSIYNKTLNYMIEHWSKYTALNLKRLTDLGTVEFRHMHGTGKTEEIEQWLSVLENLYFLAQRVKVNDKTLSDKETIARWFEILFAPAPKILNLRATLFNIIQNTLIDVKFSTI